MKDSQGVRLWFVASLIYALVCTSLGLRQAFAAEYVVQDDARQHVTWLLRLTDPGLFPRDLIADYFLSLIPAGYRGLYRLLAALGIDSLLASKIIPAFLAVTSAAYCFGFCRRIAQLPSAAFFSTVILTQCLWMNKDVASATPRAFLYPLFLAFLYHLARQNRLGIWIVVMLQGLFYPPILLVSLVVLGLSHFKIEAHRIKLVINPGDLASGGLVIVIAALSLFLYHSTSEQFGPDVSLQAAQASPDFYQGGRLPIFGGSLWLNWFTGTGGLHFPTRPYLLWLGLMLPWFCARPWQFPTVSKISADVHLLSRTAVASIFMFVAAHLLLFRLYLPSRYTQHTARIILSLLAGVTLAILVQQILSWSRHSETAPFPNGRRWIGLIACGTLFACIIGYPLFLTAFPSTGYIIGRSDDLYRYLRQQPENIVIASLSEEANNIPSFARRSILVGQEFAFPLHLGFYTPFHRRVSDLIDAQYTDDPALLRHFIETYHVSYFLLDLRAFSPDYLRKNRLARKFSGKGEEISTRTNKGSLPLVAQGMEDGIAFCQGTLVLVNVARLMTPP